MEKTIITITPIGEDRWIAEIVSQKAIFQSGSRAGAIGWAAKWMARYARNIFDSALITATDSVEDIGAMVLANQDIFGIEIQDYVRARKVP